MKTATQTLAIEISKLEKELHVAHEEIGHGMAKAAQEVTDKKALASAGEGTQL